MGLHLSFTNVPTDNHTKFSGALTRNLWQSCVSRHRYCHRGCHTSLRDHQRSVTSQQSSHRVPMEVRFRSLVGYPRIRGLRVHQKVYTIPKLMITAEVQMQFQHLETEELKISKACQNLPISVFRTTRPQVSKLTAQQP
jgi:hypothetical protein